jgi:hypothetical protein
MIAGGQTKQHCSSAVKWFRAFRLIELNAVEDIRARTRGWKGLQRWNGQGIGQIEEQRERGRQRKERGQKSQQEIVYIGREKQKALAGQALSRGP